MVIKTFSASPRRGGTIDTAFSLILNTVPRNINALGQAMFMHCNPLTGDGCTLPSPPPPSTPLQHGDCFQTGHQGGVILVLGTNKSQTGLNLGN